MLEICLGWEVREAIGNAVFEFSAIRRTTQPLRFIPLMEKSLRYNGLYRRPHEMRDGQLWCPISNAPMATTFANSRFLVPWLCEAEWALFADGADMMWLDDPTKLFELADPKYAVQVVKRDFRPTEDHKMDNQQQVPYARKGWSSLVLWNTTHPANARLTLDMVNEAPGRELHAFSWLTDQEIGDLPVAWNVFVGVDDMPVEDAKLAHFTLGIPSMEGYEGGEYADAWRRELSILDATRSRVPLGSAA